MSQSGQRVLYVSYDGMTDPLGRSQVLPYLTGLAQLGHRITLLSCEKPERRLHALAVEAICADADIEWRPIGYHRRPPVLSTIYDTVALHRAATRLHAEKDFELVHCRSYIPAMVGQSLKRRFGVRFIFDMRGFWAEERVESGSWPLRHPLYRAVFDYFKRRESDFLRDADHVVSLTEKARQQLAGRLEFAGRQLPATVIPCCVDFDHFLLSANGTKAGRTALGIEGDRAVLGYLGSIGGNYMLDEMLDFFLAYRIRHPDALFLFVTQNDPHQIQAAVRAKGIPADAVLIRSASREEVPRYIAAVDLGVAFKQPSFSALACSPTKLGEMMALGVPVVANSGVGDVREIIADTKAGITVRRFDAASLGAAIDAVAELDADRETIREGARRWFSLDEGVRRYDEIYRSLTGRVDRPAASSA